MTHSKTALLAAACLLLAGAARAADPSATYQRAVQDLERQAYAQSCGEFRELRAQTDNYHHLPPGATGAVHGIGQRLPEATRLAIEARSAGDHARACSLYFLSALRWAKQDGWMMAGNAFSDGEREYEAQHAAPAAGESPLRPGTGAIPSGTYKCFTATTARILAGGGGKVVPGSLVGSLVIRGDTYQVNEHSWGRYAVGSGGKLRWNGGEYSSKTLGRYVVQGNTPTILIGWADTDAGMACTPR